jgi:hypothetical protein
VRNGGGRHLRTLSHIIPTQCLIGPNIGLKETVVLDHLFVDRFHCRGN